MKGIQTGRKASRWALVPVKVLGDAKQRLDAALGADRRGITLAMLNDVLRAVAAGSRVEQIAVVTADPDVASVAVGYGAVVIDEIEALGMNAAIKLGVEQVRQLSGREVVVLPADIPLLTGAELDRLMQLLEAEQGAGGNSVVGITASADSRGTNLLCLETDRDFATCYGPNSYSLHLEKALQSGCRPVTLQSSAVSLDVDNHADLDAFIQTCLAKPHFQATQTWKFLQATGLLGSFGKVEGG